MIPSSCNAATTHAREKRSCQKGRARSASQLRNQFGKIDSSILHSSASLSPRTRRDGATGECYGLGRLACGVKTISLRRETERAAPRRKPMPQSARRDRSRPYDAAPQTSFARYAIFYTPQPGTALAAFGRSWFGRANDGVTLQAFSEAGFGATVFARFAPVPRRYSGLHALIKAPFAPRTGIGLDAIKTRLINFAQRRKPLATGP